MNISMDIFRSKHAATFVVPGNFRRSFSVGVKHHQQKTGGVEQILDFTGPLV